MKIITGGRGLIGSEFQEGVKLKSSDYDLREKSEVSRMINELSPTTIIHTAAKVGGVWANMNYKADFFYDNIMMNTNIIHESAIGKVENLIVFLSTCVFPDSIEYPLDESKIHLGPPHFSNDAYAYAKRMAEVQIRAYNEQYKKKYFCVIPTNVYGPHDNYDIENGHVLPSLIHKCYLAKKNNTNWEVWGDGSPLREFIFSRDVAELCDLLLEKYDGTDPVIISTSEEIHIRELVEIIGKLMNFKGNIEWLPNKPNGQYRKPSDNSKLLSIIGDYKFTPLEEGLTETIEFFVRNYERVRK
jgi:GDP-L-fucose synthase